MTTVQVMLGERSYPICVRPGGLSGLGAYLAANLEARRVVVVTTPRVGAIHFQTLSEGLARAAVDAGRIDVPEGDRAKRLSVVARLYDSLLDLEADRRTILLALGGGACCDLTGFVASTFLRGIPLVQVPTTLLAQVDASVGGKTGVNHRRGKNLIGTFYQPRVVWIDPAVLSTLPARERRAGMAEIVKAAAIWDADFFSWLEHNVERVMALESEALTHAIARACAIKAEVVGLDERESGLRALLNFGHTLGHAVENASGYGRVRHGEAVSIGMVFAASLSARHGVCSADVAHRLRALLVRVGLPVEIPSPRNGNTDAQKQAYLRAISVDKKVRDRKVGFVMLRDIGQAEVAALSPDEIFSQG